MRQAEQVLWEEKRQKPQEMEMFEENAEEEEPTKHWLGKEGESSTLEAS